MQNRLYTLRMEYPHRCMGGRMQTESTQYHLQSGFHDLQKNLSLINLLCVIIGFQEWECLVEEEHVEHKEFVHEHEEFCRTNEAI